MTDVHIDAAVSRINGRETHGWVVRWTPTDVTDSGSRFFPRERADFAIRFFNRMRARMEREA